MPAAAIRTGPWLLCTAIATFTLLEQPSRCAAQKWNYHSYLGERPPELQSERKHWLGWETQVTLKELQGKVIWLQFNF